MKLDYVEIMRRSWEITWKYKFLWLFGFIIAMTAGGNNFSNSLNYQNSGGTSNAGSSISQFAMANLVIILFFVSVLALLGFVILILSIFSQAGLVGCVAKIERGEPTSLSDGFRIGAKNFWRVLGLNLLIGLIVFCLIMVIVVPFVIIIVVMASGGNQGANLAPGLCCLIPLFILFIFMLVVVITVLSVAGIYATRFIVLEQGKVFMSFKRSFTFMRQKWTETLLTFLLVMLVSGIVGAILMIPGLLFGLPAFLTILAGAISQNIVVIVLGAVGIMFMVIFMSFLNGVLEVYRSTVWTLTFMGITGTTETSAENNPVLPQAPLTPPSPALPPSEISTPKSAAKKRPAKPKKPKA